MPPGDELVEGSGDSGLIDSDLAPGTGSSAVGASAERNPQILWKLSSAAVISASAAAICACDGLTTRGRFAIQGEVVPVGDVSVIDGIGFRVDTALVDGAWFCASTALWTAAAIVLT